MHEMGITLKDLMNASKCFSKDHFSLKLYIDDNTIVDDPEFFETHPQTLPKGVVINHIVYPFLEETGNDRVDPRNRYDNYSRVKKRGVTFPSIEEVKPLAEHFNEYAAIAEYFRLTPIERCIIENNESSNDIWTHFYNLIENKEEADGAACPYFTIKKVL